MSQLPFLFFIPLASISSTSISSTISKMKFWNIKYWFSCKTYSNKHCFIVSFEFIYFYSAVEKTSVCKSLSVYIVIEIVFVIAGQWWDVYVSWTYMHIFPSLSVFMSEIRDRVDYPWNRCLALIGPLRTPLDAALSVFALYGVEDRQISILSGLSSWLSWRRWYHSAVYSWGNRPPLSWCHLFRLGGATLIFCLKIYSMWFTVQKNMGRSLLLS